MTQYPKPIFISPSPQLSRYVASMWEWDVANAPVALSITGMLLPSVAPQFAVHYRSAMWSDRGLKSAEFRQIATGIQTKVVTVRATGSVGAIMVRLKPEAAPALLGSALRELKDSQVELRDLFAQTTVSRLIEQLGQASDSVERAALVEAFLLSELRPGATNTRAMHAARRLRIDFRLPVRQLAADVNCSERQLHRHFQASFGISPKQFARIIRMTRVLERRRRGDSWANIACDCGFTDQAHLVKDFNSLVQCAPDGFVRLTSAENVRPINAALAESTFSNTYIV